MYDEYSNTPAKANTSALTDELGQVKFVLFTVLNHCLVRFSFIETCFSLILVNILFHPSFLTTFTLPVFLLILSFASSFVKVR